MLKHASNSSAAGSTSNAAGTISTSSGQVRASSSTASQQQPPRNIHLRPPQPLNISTLSAASLASINHQSSKASASAGTVANVSITNGGQRIPNTANLLNIAHNNSNSVTAAAPSSGGTTIGSSITPITPIIPNGNAIGVASSLSIGNNRHTYSNQHVAVANNNNNQSLNNTNNTQHNETTIKTINTNASQNYSNCQNLVTSPTALSPPLPPPPLATSIQRTYQKTNHGPGPREALTSLGLLCLVSLLFALLSLIFLLKISPNGRENSITRNSNEDFVIVYDVTLALCALSLSLNVCCLLVCAIQFLFAVKLLRSPMFDGRDNKYLEKSSVSRTCAVGGFFISIPIFLTGIILYTFNHFHSTPAIITSVLIGVGIVFCGCAMVHNVFVWQKEKTISYRSAPLFNMSLVSQQFQNLQQTQQEPITQNIGLVTPPVQFLNSNGSIQAQQQTQQQTQPNNNNNNTSHYTSPINFHNQHGLSPLQLLQQHHHFHHNPGASMTPVSPNHSHGSFNPLLTGALSSSFLMRPATATPPTPKPIGNNLAAVAATAAIARATSPHGSISPAQGATLDTSNITNPSLHELSTLV